MTDYHEVPVSKPAHRNNRPFPPEFRKPVGVVDHHIVGTLPGCTATFQNGDTGYATNYGIGSADGRGGGGWWIHEYVPDDRVAWGNGNGFLNRNAVSIEHENNIAVGLAAKPRPEVHELSARFLAALAVKWGWQIGGKIQLVVRDFPNHDFYGADSIPGFGTEFNVITHRSVALKDCPKDFDIHWQVARANEIIAGLTGGNESEEDEMKNSAFIYTRTADKREVVLLVNTGSGWWMEYVNTPSIVPAGNTPVAVTLGTGSYAAVSEAFANALKGSIVRAQGVDINDADVAALAAALADDEPAPVAG